MKILKTEDLDIDGLTVEEIIKLFQGLQEKTGSDGIISLCETYGGIGSKIEYYKEETGPERSDRIHKELAKTEKRRQKYLDLKKEFE